MTEFIYISLLVYCLLGCLLLTGCFFHSKKERTYFNAGDKKINLQEVVVIVPFRNEEKRLLPLIESINQQKLHPKKILFVDDHSSDKGIDVIKQLNDSIPYEIISLPEKIEGKKAAIRFGVHHSQAVYNLTWDADIRLPDNYFNNIQKLSNADLYILPVIMKSETISGLFFESDYAMANAVNINMNGLVRPFLVSGANLLFKQNLFLAVDSFPNHAHIASGDDMYLLRDFRDNKCDVRLVTEISMAVSTEAPHTWKEFISQRLRWIGKSSDLNDSVSTFLALTSLVFNLIFYTGYLFFISREEWNLFLIVFGMKSIIDLAGYAPYFFKIKRFFTWVLLPVFSLIQPIYLLILLILLPTYKPYWKERRIYLK